MNISIILLLIYEVSTAVNLSYEPSYLAIQLKRKMPWQNKYSLWGYEDQILLQAEKYRSLSESSGQAFLLSDGYLQNLLSF